MNHRFQSSKIGNFPIFPKKSLLSVANEDGGMADMNPADLLKVMAEKLMPVDSVVPVFSGSGSGRRYYRLSGDGRTLIGTFAPNPDENAAFFYLTEHFLNHGLLVPSVLAKNDEGSCYLQQDLGDTSLFSLMDQQPESNKESSLQRALEALVLFQVKGAFDLDFRRCYPVPDFDRQAALWDLYYFKYLFLKLSGSELDESRLDLEFDSLLNRLFDDYTSGFMYRDFQSRNIMVYNNNLWFIDYQGGRRGPLAYDVASLLYQSRLALSRETRTRLLKHYCLVLKEWTGFDEGLLQKQVHEFAALRLLQTLGAYGYRGLFEKKEAFLKPIPAALVNTLAVFEDLADKDDFAYIRSLISSLSVNYHEKNNQIPGLNITISSFSFMLGLPKDPSGNGGGFVFDCRALPNPHRIPELRPFTGKDPQVEKWLAGQPEVEQFLQHCLELVMQSADNYLSRGFTHLQVNFGCTGGKHRSVFCAEALKTRLLETGKDMNVRIEHLMI
jgi:aminoglycoside/choline kinase family phosphotransferase